MEESNVVGLDCISTANALNMFGGLFKVPFTQETFLISSILLYSLSNFT
jgi:hypothetical protein